MKRSDLDTRTVLAAIAEHRFEAHEHLARRFPPKLVLAAFLREDQAGRTEYGVAAHLPWLTDAGRATLAALDTKEEPPA